MPIYEYSCRKGHHFELMQSFSAKPVAQCPRCGEKSERIISLSAFHLKGSGWYSKDSSGAKSNGATSTPTSAEPAAAPSDSPTDKPAEKASTVSDDKPAKKKEKKPKKQ